MKNIIKNTVVTLFAIICFEAPAAVQAKAVDVHEMADICMYSQRLLKDYALIGMNVTYGDPAKDLQDGVIIIDKYLADIESHHLKALLGKEVREIHRLWVGVKKKLLKTPVKASMMALHDEVEAMVKRCELVAEHLAQDTGIKGENAVVLIAELGMETQRLGALYMMKAWGIGDDKYLEKVEKIVNEFKEIEEELLHKDEKLVSAEIKKKLKGMDNNFRVLTVLAQTAGKSGRFAPTRFERSASKIFNEIRKILKLEEHNVEK